MARRTFTPPEIEKLKRDAKRSAKAEGLGHREYLNRFAVQEGYRDFRELQHFAKSPGAPTPQPNNRKRPVIRFVMDPKDSDDIFPLGRVVNRQGIERDFDDDFAEMLNRKLDPEEPWNVSVSIFRYTDPNGEGLAGLGKVLRKVFFFTPDSVWLDDKEVPLKEWAKHVPGMHVDGDITVLTADEDDDDIDPRNPESPSDGDLFFGEEGSEFFLADDDGSDE